LKREWLEAYESEEQEVARRLMDKHLQGPDIDLATFYEDKAAFKDTYVYEMGLPLTLPLLFYEQVITELAVPRDSQAFEKLMGMDVETYASLYKRRRLIPRMTWPTKYADLDYLDPLLELKPPTIARANALVKTILAKRGLNPIKAMDFRSEAQKVIDGRFGDLANQFQQVNRNVDQLYIESLLIDNHVKLKSLGYTEIADSILSVNQPLTKLASSLAYSMILAKPIVDGVGGWPQTDERSLRLMGKMDLKLDPTYLFPTEVGRFLTKTYALDSVISADASMLDGLYSEGAIVKARRLLSELDKAVRAKDAEKVADRSLDMEKVFDDARASMSWIERARKISGTLAIAGIGWVAGKISGLPPETTAGMGGVIGYLMEQFGESVAGRVLDKGVDLVARPLSALGFDALPLAIWRFERNWRETYGRSPPKP
jgi:hypothetical protein